jgi:signal transduction histidine kinase
MSASTRARHYVLSVGAVGLALVMTAFVVPLIEAPYFLFFAAVVVSAWAGGLGPGLATTALSVLAIDFFFLPPIYSLGTGLADGIRLTAFVLVAVLVSSLQEHRRRLENDLRRRERFRAELLAVVAHELRNVLSPMACTFELLRAPNATPKVTAHAREVLARQQRSMARLIEDLLDSASAEQGKLRLSRQKIDLRGPVEQAVEAIRADVERRGHRLEVVLPPAPVFVDCDPSRLEQIIVNLVANAAKYTDPGGHVRLEVDQSGREARARIRDTGVGLTAEAQERIFDLFVQGESGRRGGLGIGLSLARELARLHGGDITVFSEGPGQGCEFVLRLPLALGGLEHSSGL